MLETMLIELRQALSSYQDLFMFLLTLAGFEPRREALEGRVHGMEQAQPACGALDRESVALHAQ